MAGCGRLPGTVASPVRAHTVGFLAPSTSPGAVLYFDVLRQGLQELGYMEGTNLVLALRSADGRIERYPALVTELVGLSVDVLVTTSPPSTRAAKSVTQTIPIVMAVSSDPVPSGLITSLAHPGGNVTGLSALTPQLSGKRLELLTQAVPNIREVAVLWNAADPDKALDFAETQAAAQVLGLHLTSLEVRAPDEFADVFGAAQDAHPDALIILEDPLTVVYEAQIVEWAAQSRLPAMYETPTAAHAGGLIAYGPRLTSLFHRAAYYVDRILQGTNPADLPVEQPMTFDFVINLKTARALGLTIPQEVLLQTTEVIQ
ncbi:MAG TPA: ABC transporter substrate-binding protein [Chloroflexota bacterium]